jgi:hypothetical protein
MSITKTAILFSTIILSNFATVTSSFISFISSAEASTKLGDLSKFKKIVVETNELVKKEDLAGAKTRIKDLETTWDEAEAGVKPRASADWHALDKAIDHALSALRENKPSINDSKKMMTELLATFEKLEK